MQILQKLKEFRWFEGTDPETKRARILRKVKWLISISRNTLVVLTSTVIAYYLVETYKMRNLFILTGEVEEGLPAWQLPWRFNLNATSTASNLTASKSPPGPLEIAEDLGIGLVMLPLVSVLQQLAIAKFYTRKPSK